MYLIEVTLIVAMMISPVSKMPATTTDVGTRQQSEGVDIRPIRRQRSVATVALGPQRPAHKSALLHDGWSGSHERRTGPHAENSGHQQGRLHEQGALSG